MQTKKNILSTLFLITLALTIPLTIHLSLQTQQTKQQAAESVSFNPAIIPAETEIGNPMRGPEYYGGAEPPPDFPLIQYSDRWCWNEIEPSEGQYNLQLIEDLAVKAKTNGGSAGWRIMPLNPSGNGNCLPDYLSSKIGQNFDDPYYLQRVEAMLNTIAQKYANDPRIDVLDMSYVGCWGEWNDACGVPVPSSATRKAIIDAQFKAFPNKLFVMLTGTSETRDSIHYALQVNRPKMTGVRSDCLGEQNLGGDREVFDEDTIINSQWTKAPLYFEYCGGPNFSLAQQDIVKYHASIIGDGDGNIDSFSSYSAEDQQTMLQNYRVSGYRYILNNVTTTSPVTAGEALTITSQWSNINVAPTYIPWSVLFQLRNQSNQTIWEGKSQLDLKSIVPTGNTPKSTTDNFTLPANIPAESYTLTVQIVDPEKYYPPLQLAIQGKQTDGSYTLGTVTVGGTNQPNPSTPPTTSTAPFISPGFECMGGTNCIPSMMPSTPIDTNPIPLSTTNPIPSTNPLDPCSNISQSVMTKQEAQRHKRHKENNDNGVNNSTGLIKQLLELFLQIINLILQLIGGSPITTPIPQPAPIPQPTPCEPTVQPIPSNPPSTSAAPQPSNACTKEAKICPDGTTVERTGPNCEFTACSGIPSATVPSVISPKP